MASEDLSSSNFGLLIAYVIPGFTALHGIPGLAGDPAVLSAVGNEQSLAVFLSVTVDALFVGLTLSAVRWMVIDSVHHRTGIHPPEWDFSELEKATDAYTLLIKNHYQYYKFYANMVLALLWAYASGGYAAGWRGLIYAPLLALFYASSRDALRKYYARAGKLLSQAKCG